MRLIDADELKEKMLEYEITIKRINKNRISNKEQAILLDIGGLLDNAPTIDAVPVVRCKDCTYCSHFTDGHLECRLLYNLKPVATTYCQMEENDFCSYGAKKRWYEKDEKKAKSSDFYPCADEDGMVGR